jgi:hypothetical protein
MRLNTFCSSITALLLCHRSGVLAQISTTPVMAQVDYHTAAPTEIQAFFPIGVPSGPLTVSSGRGFANAHVTVFEAVVYTGTDAVDDIVGWVTMQTKPNGNYTLVFDSGIIYGDPSTAFSIVWQSSTVARTWVTCYAAAPEDPTRTCNSVGELISGTTVTNTYTFSSGGTGEPYTQVRTETLAATYSTRTSNSFLVPMSTHMRTVSMDTLLTRRPTSEDKSTMTAAPGHI